jgi:hypothetical protein
MKPQVERSVTPAIVVSVISLMFMMPAPARAEVVTLVCQDDSSGHIESGHSFTLRVDYDRKIVDLLHSDGTVFLSETATVTESDVRWHWDNAKWDYSSPKAQGFMGGLDRLSGRGSVTYKERQVILTSMSGPCRRATQKF